MNQRKKWLLLPAVLALSLLVYLLVPGLLPADSFGFSAALPEQEAALRTKLVDTACGWAGIREADGSHRPIVDRYNAITPLPQDYTLTYEDSWCAAFVTVCALESDLADIIPAECSCARQIKLLQDLGRWEEDDGYRPLPGDLIYYDWNFSKKPDCTGWPEHVGIVVGTYGPFIRVMEGNKDDDASFRVIWQNDWCIRGYGLPDYASKCK
jgi:hypothetical protein